VPHGSALWLRRTAVRLKLKSEIQEPKEKIPAIISISDFRFWISDFAC
jgi:hypothetical protein